MSPSRRSLLLWRLRRHPAAWWTLAALAVLCLALGLQGVLGATTACPPRPEGTPRTAGGDVAGSVPAGTRAIAVPVSGALPVAAGDEVDLVAPADVLVEGGEADARTVAEQAVVLQVAADAVTLAVDEDHAADAALAAAQGGATLVLRGTG